MSVYKRKRISKNAYRKSFNKTANSQKKINSVKSRRGGIVL